MLAEWIPALKPSFMLFLGDFIYFDVPATSAHTVENYRANYRRVYGSPSWPEATKELPWIHVIDDHEIANDWDKNTTGIYWTAADPWEHYHVAANPPRVRDGESYFSFTQGPAAVFMIDTRRYRSPETDQAMDKSKTMLGSQQRKDLIDWIKSEPPAGVKFKIVASSVPFTKNWRFGDKDTWGKYLYERQILLNAMNKATVAQGVQFIVISGDRHEFAATILRDLDSRRGADVWEFSVSPLNMFYLPTRTYVQKDEEDVKVQYLPDGQNKWGAIEITSSPEDPEQANLNFRLFIGGKEVSSIKVPSWTGKQRPRS
jgi:alkaline phosphatase D